MAALSLPPPPIVLTRRQALLGSAAAALIGATAAPRALAQPSSAMRLVVGRRTLEVNGKAAPVYSLAPAAGKRVGRFTRGQNFTVALENQLDEPTLVHWHGLTPPTAQDGMPGLSQPPLGAGASYAYDFPLTRAGTFWMHSHVGFQRAKLLVAPLIVAEPQEATHDEQEVVLFLSDFSFREPEAIFAGLTGGHGAMPGMAGMDHGAMTHAAMPDMHMNGGMAGDMAMGGDVNDVDFDAYLANDRTLADPEVVAVEPGARVRLRIINGAAATNFWLDLGALSGAVIAVDGDPVAPLTGSRFELAMAQRIDLRVALPAGQGAYPILARREGAAERTGIVLATRNAVVAKLAPTGAAAPLLRLALESRLRAEHPLAPRKPDRTLAVDLTGDMARFVWGINGKRYGEDTPLAARRGERVALVMRNRTPMSHPMHLHGHHFQVVAIGDHRFAGALRDTVLVPAMGSVTVAFDADNPGRWAFHCHNEYHMAAGMMTSLEYGA
jgi:FtsP/CotA-like multicopper oxidase with cupredoxin domain